jgi:hypothetical protein
VSDPLDQTALLCDPFYEVRPGLGRTGKGDPVVQPGQIVWAHQVYPATRPFIIDIKGYDPRDLNNNTYVVSQLGTASPTHFPVKELSLRSDENLYVLYGKKRPAIVLQTLESDFYNRQNPEPYVVAAPCFTFKEKHRAEYRARVAAMEFPNLFFLPAHPPCFSQQAVIRFEHIQPVTAASVEPQMTDGTKQCFLSDIAWAILQHRLSLFMIGNGLDARLEEDLSAYHDCVMDAYRPSSV